jgi:hypothetical protein
MLGAISTYGRHGVSPIVAIPTLGRHDVSGYLQRDMVILGGIDVEALMAGGVESGPGMLLRGDVTVEPMMRDEDVSTEPGITILGRKRKPTVEPAIDGDVDLPGEDD